MRDYRQMFGCDRGKQHKNLHSRAACGARAKETCHGPRHPRGKDGRARESDGQKTEKIL